MTKKIKVVDIPGQQEANRVMNNENLGHKSKMSIISRTTGICHKCKEKPAAKLVLIRIPGAYRMERYCLEDFPYSDYETKKKRVK